ncbi:MAG: hypothetical protein ACSNEK_08525 [Parachlamydiaceae bacterium]
MKLLFSCLFFIGLACSPACEGALPPLWESVSQIEAILESSDLKNVFNSGEVIESIARTEDGFLVVTNHREVRAIVKAKPQAMPGPAVYEVTFIK